MPYLTDKEKIDNPFLDRRVKLIPCQREMVLYWYKQGTSIRAIARMFHVDKGTIQFILFPERLQRNRELRQARGGSKIYYKKEKNTKAMREHRQYKYAVLKDATIRKRGADK